MRAGKHVQVEIPLADSWADARAVDRVQRETGLVCMVGHTRRFNPSHQWVHRRIVAGELSIQQMDVQTYFFRRTNMNALGAARAAGPTTCCGTTPRTRSTCSSTRPASDVAVANAVQGPIHPELGIAMDMSIQLRTAGGQDLHAVAELQQRRPARHVLPLHLRQRHLHRPLRRPGRPASEEPIDVSHVDVSTNGIELQDREFVAAIREGREPNSSIASVLGCYRVLGELETQLASQR